MLNRKANSIRELGELHERLTISHRGGEGTDYDYDYE